MVMKVMMNVINEEKTIPEEVLGTLNDFKELITDEIPKQFSSYAR